MSKRTQLNINISPDLLRDLKRAAIKSGKNLTTFVTEILEKEMIQNNSFESIDSNELLLFEERLKSLEDHVYLLKSK